MLFLNYFLKKRLHMMRRDGLEGTLTKLTQNSRTHNKPEALIVALVAGAEGGAVLA